VDLAGAASSTASWSPWPSSWTWRGPRVGPLPRSRPVCSGLVQAAWRALGPCHGRDQFAVYPCP